MTAPVLDVLGKSDDWQAAKNCPAKSTAAIPPIQEATVPGLLMVRSPYPPARRLLRPGASSFWSVVYFPESA